MNRLEEVHMRILEGLSGEARKDAERGLRLLGIDNPSDKEALRQSIKKLRPDFTDAQVELFVQGKAESERDWV